MEWALMAGGISLFSSGQAWCSTQGWILEFRGTSKLPEMGPKILHIKVVEGSLWHIWTYAWLSSEIFNVVLEVCSGSWAFQQSKTKTKCATQRGSHGTYLRKVDPRRAPPLNSTPASAVRWDIIEEGERWKIYTTFHPFSSHFAKV